MGARHKKQKRTGRDRPCRLGCGTAPSGRWSRSTVVWGRMGSCVYVRGGVSGQARATVDHARDVPPQSARRPHVPVCTSASAWVGHPRVPHEDPAPWPRLPGEARRVGLCVYACRVEWGMAGRVREPRVVCQRLWGKRAGQLREGLGGALPRLHQSVSGTSGPSRPAFLPLSRCASVLSGGAQSLRRGS